MNFFKKILYIVRLFWKAFGAYKLQITLLTVVGFFSGFLEGVGANALIPLFSFISGEENGGNDVISKFIAKAFAYVGVDFNLKYLLVFIAMLFIIRSVVLFGGSYMGVKVMHNYEKNTRVALFKKALRSKWRYISEQKIGHLEKILSAEVHLVAVLFKNLGSFILLGTGLVMYIFVAINISFTITAITLGVGVLFLIVSHPLIRKIRELSRNVAVKTRENVHFINENVLGMKTIKAMAVEAHVVARAEAQFEALRSLQLKRSLVGSIFGSFFQPFGVIFILLLFSLSYKTSTFHLPSFIAIVYLIQRIFSHVQTLQTSVQSVFSSIPYVENVLKYQKQTLKNEEEDAGGRVFTFNKTFAFRDVYFRYQRGAEILAGVSFTVAKGSFVGLVGPSGAGKTTIVDLALRLFKPDKGDILLDGVSIADIDLRQWRKNVGYVSQDIHLINDTVANNIRFFDDTIRDEDIIRAAKDANIYDTIDALPEKFSSVVGERGIRLSVGQRQRIVIARVLARNPELLILDEATSALDNESENRIQEVMGNFKGKITVLVIAHRLETVTHSDELLVLGGGRIAERGKPADLLKNKESYFYKTYNIRK